MINLEYMAYIPYTGTRARVSLRDPVVYRDGGSPA